MITQDSIHALSRSFDVYEYSVVQSINEAKEYFKEKYNTHLDPTVNKIGNIEIEGNVYWLYETYVDSGSNDYYFFSIKR